MLEVIAVLAISAIIGAGGVGGYTAAMRKYRANELITEASGRALAVSQQLMTGKELKEADFGGYPATDTGHGKFPEKPIPLTGDEFFKIPITGMDKPTCDQMKAIAGGSLRRVDCKEENGKVTADLIYQKDLSATEGKIPGDTDGTSGGTGNTATRSYDNNRQGCEENGYQYCSNNICITKEEVCESGSASCAQYPGTSTLNSGGHAGKADDGETMCYCPGGQVYTETNGCIPACSGHGTLDENEDCVCQGGYYGVVCENQVTCQHGTWTVDGCECDEGWYGPLCDFDCDGFTYDWRGKCVPCSSYDGFRTTKSECDRCRNTSYPREIITSTVDGRDYCVLTAATCNASHPEGGFRNYDIGDCVPCSLGAAILTDKRECDSCENTNYPREIISYNGKNRCALTSTSCDAKYPEGAFREMNGSCYECFAPYDYISTTQSECDKCLNTRYPRKMDGGKCVPNW